MSNKVSGQSSPGKGKRSIRPSFIVLIVSILAYGGASVYASRVAQKQYEAALPVPWLKTYTTDLRAFYMKARPARFPRDLAELDREVWKTTRAEGRRAPEFGENNLTYVFENYKYYYFPVANNPTMCTILAVPLGPRRDEPGVKTIFLILTPTAISTWEGRALSDEDMQTLHPGIPTVGTLQRWGLVNTDAKVVPTTAPTPLPKKKGL